jgi:iron complex outermembrane receptor protein
LNLVLLAGASLAAFATTAVAQDSDDDTIVVTGSRIRQNPLDRSQPLLDVDADDLTRSGLNNVGDFLQRIPGSGGGLNSRVNSSGNFGNPPDGGGVGAGSSEIDLRFLGSRRVLVLVDGLRWVNGSSASGVPGATDLNTIPSSIIDRIEILQDGASPIYGSDAIAGVINIITKRRQDGFAASAQLGAFDDTDGETQQYEVSFGAGDGATEFFAAVQYVHQNTVTSGDRDISDFPVATLDECFVTCSSATPRGRFVLTDPITMTDLNLTLREGFLYSGSNPVYNPAAPGGGTDDFEPFTTADRFNFSPFNYVVTPSERWGGFVQLTHEFTETLSFRGKALFNNRTSVNQAAPIPLFIGPEAGNGNRLDTISVDVTNPFNPFGFTIDAATNPYFIGRRLFEAGPRNFTQDVETFYVSGTFEGEVNLLGRDFFWDFNAVWSKNRAEQIGLGIVNSLNLQNALGPVAACTAPCVPFNIFGGPGSVTPAMLDYITFTQRDRSSQELVDFTLNVSGDLFELPAGPLGFAGGVEHRVQRGSFTPDPVVVAGNSADIPAQPTSGSFNVQEVYGEIKVPLLADLAVTKALEASFAIRYSTYSTGPSTTTIKYGGRWQPFDDLTIRGGFTEGFRAASIGELFGTASRFDATLSDPCSDYAGLGGGTPASAATQANCMMLGVPTSYVQTNFQISTVTGGNTALNPENSDGWNVGFTYQPGWAETHNFVLEANYYDIEVNGAIQAPDAQLLLNGCVATLDPAFCGNITRAGTGTIIAFSNQLTNIGGVETNGIDWRVAFDVPDTGIGDFHFEVLGNHLLEYLEINPTATGFVATAREGTLRGSPTFSWPEFKANMLGELVTGPFRLRAVGRYISSIDEACPGPFNTLAADVGCSRPDTATPANSFNDLGSRFYLDLAASWTLPWLEDRLEFTIGGNNVIGSDPPDCFTCQLNGFDPNTYDVPGRFGYVRLTFRP